MAELLYGDDIDHRLSWPLGRADRLARRGKLPHVLLPDGSVRFEWEEIVKLVRHVSVAREQEVNHAS